MTLQEIRVLLPFIMIAGAGVAVMMVAAFFRNHLLAVGVTMCGLFMALAAAVADPMTAPQQVTPLILVDAYSKIFFVLIILATMAVALLSFQFLETYATQAEEMYMLLLFAALGAMTVAASSHFASFFIGLEILGVSLYAAIAYIRTDPLGIEAGIKYMILAATSDAILLFGMALLYAETGTLQLGDMARTVAAGTLTTVAMAGATLFVVGIGFKLSLVPFHMWTPDVYEGAPAVVTGFLATVSKGAVFAALLRYFTQTDLVHNPGMIALFSVIAAASMIGGNLLALFQENAKRILGYSSIAHMGYLVVAFLSAPDMAAQAVGYYFAAYFAATLGAFGVIGVMGEKEGERPSNVSDFRGLFWRKPFLAAVFTLMLLSLAGIPLTAGFMGKFYVMAAGAKSSLWTLVIILIATGTIGLYYYLRIIAYMCMPVDEAHPDRSPAMSHGAGSGFALAMLTLATLILGVFPGYLVGVLQRSVPF